MNSQTQVHEFPVHAFRSGGMGTGKVKEGSSPGTRAYYVPSLVDMRLTCGPLAAQIVRETGDLYSIHR